MKTVTTNSGKTVEVHTWGHGAAPQRSKTIDERIVMYLKKRFKK